MTATQNEIYDFLLLDAIGTTSVTGYFSREGYVHWCATLQADIVDNGIMTGAMARADNPDEALVRLVNRLQEVQAPAYIRVRNDAKQRHFRWNGASFIEVE